MGEHQGQDESALLELVGVRSEMRAEINMLHERVNALLAAESFLTVGFAVTMSNGTAWGESTAVVIAPVLSVLGMLLAFLGGLGIASTARLIHDWTLRQKQLLRQNPALLTTSLGWAADGGDRHRALRDQQRGLLFFRAVPFLFGITWCVLLAVALIFVH